MNCQYIDGLLQGPDMIFEHSPAQKFLCFFFNSVQESDTWTKAHNFYFSELLPRSVNEESIKNKSQKIGIFQKPKCPQKDKVFEKVWRLQKIWKVSKD